MHISMSRPQKSGTKIFMKGRQKVAKGQLMGQDSHQLAPLLFKVVEGKLIGAMLARQADCGHMVGKMKGNK